MPIERIVSARGKPSFSKPLENTSIGVAVNGARAVHFHDQGNRFFARYQSFSARQDFRLQAFDIDLDHHRLPGGKRFV